MGAGCRERQSQQSDQSAECVGGGEAAGAAPRRGREDQGRRRRGAAVVVVAAGRRDLHRERLHRHVPLRIPRGLLRRVPPGPRPRVPRHVPRREQERAARRWGVAGPDAAAAVPPPHRAPRRRHAAPAPRRRARAPHHGVGAAGAGQRPRALELRPRRERVAVRGQEPRPPRRVPDEGPPRDRHHRRPAAAPAPRAGERPARRHRIGSVEAGGEDEAGRGRQPHRRLPEVSPGEGSGVHGHANAGLDGIRQRPSLRKPASLTILA